MHAGEILIKKGGELMVKFLLALQIAFLILQLTGHAVALVKTILEYIRKGKRAHTQNPAQDADPDDSKAPPSQAGCEETETNHKL